MQGRTDQLDLAGAAREANMAESGIRGRDRGSECERASAGISRAQGGITLTGSARRESALARCFISQVHPSHLPRCEGGAHVDVRMMTLVLTLSERRDRKGVAQCISRDAYTGRNGPLQRETRGGVSGQRSRVSSMGQESRSGDT